MVELGQYRSKTNTVHKQKKSAFQNRNADLNF